MPRPELSETTIASLENLVDEDFKVPMDRISTEEKVVALMEKYVDLYDDYRKHIKSQEMVSTPVHSELREDDDYMDKVTR